MANQQKPLGRQQANKGNEQQARSPKNPCNPEPLDEVQKIADDITVAGNSNLSKKAHLWKAEVGEVYSLGMMAKVLKNEKYTINFTEENN